MCSCADSPEYSLVAQDVCYIQRLQEVHLISEGSDQTTDVQVQSVHADLTLHTNFIVGFAIHTLVRVVFVQTFTQHSE